MIAERWCPVHSEPLLELTCAHQHGWIWDAKTRTRHEPNFEVDEWLLVIDGIVAAVCDGERTRWLRQPFDGGTRRLAGRTENGTGGRAWSMDMQYERRKKNQDEAKRRQLEREKARRQGRAPAEWAALLGRIEEAEA